MLGEPTPLNIAMNVASTLASFAVLGCCIFVIVKCFQKDRTVHGVLGIIGTLTARDRTAEEKYDELEVRALTGAGAEKAVTH